MKNIVKHSCVTVIAAIVFAGCSNHACAREQEIRVNDSLVGRIAYIEGQLLRYVPDEDDWVLTEADTPFGEYDNVFSSMFQAISTELLHCLCFVYPHVDHHWHPKKYQRKHKGNHDRIGHQ